MLTKIFKMSGLQSPWPVSNIWLYGGLVCIHTRLVLARTGIPELGVLESDGTARKADTFSLPGILVVWPGALPSYVEDTKKPVIPPSLPPDKQAVVR